MNMGSEDNINRMLAEDIPQDLRLTRDEIDVLLGSLDKRDWDFTQALRDQINSYWPEISAVEQRRTGVKPKKVEGIPIQTKFGVYEGGYYPIKYDPQASANADTDVQTATDQFLSAGRAGKAQTKNGYSKERKKTGNGRAVLYELSGSIGHMKDAIRGIALSEAVDAASKHRSHPPYRDRN